MHRAKIFLLAGLCAPSLAAAAPAVMAYDANPNDYAFVAADKASLNIVAADDFAVSITGQISGKVSPKILTITKANHITLLASVSNYTGNGFNSKIATAILTPGAAQNAAIAGITALAGANYTGINIDFEAVPHKERSLYTAFVQKLAAALHAAGKILWLSVPAKQADDPTDSWAGAYDFATLGKSADTLQIMTYDENGPWGPAGPVAGRDWVKNCMAYAASVVPVAQLSMGMPAYGYDWNTTKGTGGSINWNQIPALLQKTKAVPQWDTASTSPYLTYTAGNGDAHIVWYENAASITAKGQYAASRGVASVSVWALGLDDQNYWSALAAGLE
jgi:spore germination protein YaaH